MLALCMTKSISSAVEITGKENDETGLPSCKHARVTNTPLHPTFNIVKLGFTGAFFLFLLQNIDCGYSLNRLTEAVLTCTHHLCFEQKLEKHHNFSSENYLFLGREKLLYITWTCFRNAPFYIVKLGFTEFIMILISAE